MNYKFLFNLSIILRNSYQIILLKLNDSQAITYNIHFDPAEDNAALLLDNTYQ